MSKKNTPGALYANKNLSSIEIKSYQEDLDSALKDDRITNIAITAPYGTGKSSVLESYFEIRKDSYPWYIRLANGIIKIINSMSKKIGFTPTFINEITDFEFINLPNFFKDSNENELQKKIIEQLLLSSNPKRYPFSKLKRIKDSWWALDFFKLINFLFMMIVPVYLFIRLTNKEDIISSFVNSLTKINLLLIVVTIVLVMIFLVWIIRRFRISLSKSTISGKGKFGPFELSSNIKPQEDDEVDIFNIFSEELLYFFRETNKKIIIFEDIDRFEDPKIFQELRELNININKRQSKVVFIYSLQDKVFDKVIKETTKEETNTFDKRTISKAKFFDFVVPIFPTTSLYNSSQSIEEELKKYNFQISDSEGKLSKYFIRNMGLFLKDQRMIILIVSEFDSYFKMIDSLKEKDINQQELFSTIVYKNFYAKDFEKIARNNSLLNRVFDKSEKIYSTFLDLKIKKMKERKNEIEKNIHNLKKMIDYDTSRIIKSYFWEIILKKNMFTSLSNSGENYLLIDNEQYSEEEARQFFLDLIESDKSAKISFRSNRYGNRNLGIARDILRFIPDIESFIVLLEMHSQGEKTSDLIQKLRKKIITINEDVRKTRQDVYGLTIGEVLKELDQMDIGAEEELNSILDEISKDNFKRYLFFNNYVTSNFYSYISPVNFSDNKQDSLFIESVLSYRELDDYDILDPKTIVKELDLSSANYSFAYSSNLLAYLFKQNNKYEDEINLIISKMIDKNDYEFWDNLIIHTSREDLVKNDYEIIREIIMLLEKSRDFLKQSFSEISEYSNMSLIYALLNNPKSISEVVREDIIGNLFNYIINDLNSFNNFMSALVENTKSLKTVNFFDNYRTHMKIEKLSNILDNTDTRYDYEIIQLIYSEGLYVANYKNFDAFSKLFDINSKFQEVTKKFEELDVKYLNLSDFYQFYKEKYNQGVNESYPGFREYIDFCLGNHQFYNQFSQNDSLELLEDEVVYNCVESYSKVTLEEDDYSLKDEIINKLGLVQLIKSHDLEDIIITDLIETHKLSYSDELLIALDKSYPEYIVDYLLSIYVIYPDFFQKNFENINELIGERERLILIKEIDNQEDYIYISSFLLYEDISWNDLYEKDSNFFNESLACKLLLLDNFKLYKLLIKYTNYKIQVETLKRLLDKYPKKLSLVELEQLAQNEAYFSDPDMKADGNKHYPINPEVSRFIMKVFDDLNIINYVKHNSKITFHAVVREYFKVE